jgi:hypothetical protein
MCSRISVILISFLIRKVLPGTAGATVVVSDFTGFFLAHLRGRDSPVRRLRLPGCIPWARRHCRDVKFRRLWPRR